MQKETKEPWKQLCERAAIEQERSKFLAIIQELDKELAERDLDLKTDPEVFSDPKN